MNERIKELARQSQMVFWPTDPEVVELSKDIDIEKFAELLVKECADVADTADATREKWQSIGKFVKEHFGVAEK